MLASYDRARDVRGRHAAVVAASGRAGERAALHSFAVLRLHSQRAGCSLSLFTSRRLSLLNSSRAAAAAAAAFAQSKLDPARQHVD